MFAQAQDLDLYKMVALRGEKIAFSVDEARFLTGLGKSTLYRLVRDGKLDAMHIGRRRLLILRTSLENYMRAEAAAAATERAARRAQQTVS